MKGDAPEIKLAYFNGFEQGKKYAQNKADELLEEIIYAYEKIGASNESKMPFFKEAIEAGFPDAGEDYFTQGQINAVRFAQKWLSSGGVTDLSGNRACLPPLNGDCPHEDKYDATSAKFNGLA